MMQLLPNGSYLGKYLIANLLDRGQFGEVYLVHDTALDTSKVLKLMKVDDPQNFSELVEAQLTLKCQHTNCVRINEADVYSVNNEAYAVLDVEYLPNGSLEKRLNDKYLPIVTGVRYLIDALTGLEHIHNQGVLHLDIKPGNILLSNIRAKISDFGIASFEGIRAIDVGGYRPHLPPEYWASGETSHQTDVFGAGITLFRVVNNYRDFWLDVTNVTDFQTKLESGTLLSHLKWEKYVPKQLRRIINKACHKDTNKRYQNSREFRQALEKLKVQHNWNRLSDRHWISSDPSQVTEALVVGTRSFSFVIKRNGRRLSSSIQKFKSEIEAIEYLENYIASTTYK